MTEEQTEPAEALMPTGVNCTRCGRGAVFFLIGENGLGILSRHRGRFFNCSGSGAFTFLMRREEEDRNKAVPVAASWRFIQRMAAESASAEASAMADETPAP